MGALSDLAAMGAAPLAALVALCVPGGSGDGELALGVMAGVAEASVAGGCPVVGGDVSESAVLMVAVTVLGTVDPRWSPGLEGRGATRGRAPPHRPVRRVRGRIAGPAGGPRSGCRPTGARWRGSARARSPGGAGRTP